MTDMPETIWAVFSMPDFPMEGGEWLEDKSNFVNHDAAIQYTRTDTILVDHVDKADAWDACTERKPPQVKVKPLVWVEHDSKHKYGSYFLSGAYEINRSHGGFWLYFAGNVWPDQYETLEDAKAAARAHHDAAILSAIGQAPLTDHDRAVIEAAEKIYEAEISGKIMGHGGLFDAIRARKEALSAIEGEG